MKNKDINEWLLENKIDDFTTIINMNGKEVYISDVLEKHLIEQLMQTAVSSQRELLFAYEKMRTNHIVGGTDDWRYSNVDLFLSK
jgi:hypothetical protein